MDFQTSIFAELKTIGLNAVVHLLGSSRKFDVRRWRPLADAWNANGPRSSFENIEAFEIALFMESREFLRLAKYAKPW